MGGHLPKQLDEFFMIRVGSLYDLSLLPQEHRDNKTGGRRISS